LLFTPKFGLDFQNFDFYKVMRYLIPFILVSKAWILFGQTSIGMVSVSPYAGNSLRQVLTYSTVPASLSFVKFGYVSAGDTLWEHTDVTPESIAHEVVLSGLRPSETYHFQVFTFDSTGQFASPAYSFMSGTMPFSTPVLDSHNISVNVPRGYFLSASPEQDSVRYAMLFDTSGTVVWYERLPGSWRESTCLGLQFNPKYAEVALSDCDTMISMRFDGKSRRAFRFPFLQGSMAQAVRHDRIEFLDNRKFRVLVAVPDTIVRSQPPFVTEIVLVDALLELDSIQYRVLADQGLVGNPQMAPGPGGRWTDLFGSQSCEWKDVRGFGFDFDGFPVLATSKENTIEKFDRPDQIAWSMGPQGSISILPTDSLKVPSAVLPSGSFSYYSYDKGGNNGSDRLLKWYIDWSYITPELYQEWDFSIPNANGSLGGGSLELLPSGELLVSSKRGGYIGVLDSDGALLGQWIFTGGLDAASWVDRLYPKPDFGHHAGASVVCATDTVFDLRNLQVTPQGGFWSGDYVSGELFTPAVAGPGFHEVVYHFGGDAYVVRLDVGLGGCTNQSEEGVLEPMRLMVYPNPVNGGVLNLEGTIKSGKVIWSVVDLLGEIVDEGFWNSNGGNVSRVQLSVEGWPKNQVLALSVRTMEGQFLCHRLVVVPN
jgi:hypothetical protein